MSSMVEQAILTYCLAYFRPCSQAYFPLATTCEGATDRRVVVVAASHFR